MSEAPNAVSAGRHFVDGPLCGTTICWKRLSSPAYLAICLHHTFLVVPEGVWSSRGEKSLQVPDFAYTHRVVCKIFFVSKCCFYRLIVGSGLETDYLCGVPS